MRAALILVSCLVLATPVHAEGRGANGRSDKSAHDIHSHHNSSTPDFRDQDLDIVGSSGQHWKFDAGEDFHFNQNNHQSWNDTVTGVHSQSSFNSNQLNGNVTVGGSAFRELSGSWESGKFRDPDYAGTVCCPSGDTEDRSGKADIGLSR